MTTSNDNTFRVWVGCLACYNAGRLIGEWFDADSCPQDEDEFNDAIPGHVGMAARDGYPHEELWVMDHENSPVDGEYSPMAAAEYAEWLDGLEDDQVDAFRAWLKGTSRDFDNTAVSDFEDAYVGTYEGGYHNGNFVGKGYAEEVIEEERAQAMAIVDDLSKYSGDSRGVEWLKGKIEQWGYLEDACSRAWDMEANGEIAAYEGPDGEAYCFRP